jgi:hypothetical protein
VPKKARVLTKEQVEKFLVEAPDDYWLLYKVITIFGIFGACRCDELLSLTVKDVDQKLASDSSGLPGGFSGQRAWVRILKNGRQAAIVLSWLLLVQLPGQVLRSYSSKVSKSKRFLIVKQILVYSVTAKLSTEQYLVVRYWFTRMR